MTMKYKYIYFKGEDGYVGEVEAVDMLKAVQWIFDHIEFDYVQSVEEIE